MTTTKRSRLKAGVALAAIIAQLAASAGTASAFCGFYVAKANSKLFNKSSKVVLARDGQETAITMASDYEGEPKEFAVVVPVPTFIRKDQIGVVDTKTIDHLDAYTAPRLVEYYDDDPCDTRKFLSSLQTAATAARALPTAPLPAPAYAGVKVEAQYDVAEYDISILSAEQSDGLIRWLTDNGYKIPAGAEPVIGSYIKQKMHFFVAKVNVKRMQRARPHLFAAAASALRDGQIHAAAAARHRQRERAAGPDRLCADQGRARRDYQLPHRQSAVRRRSPAVRQGRLRQFLQGDVRPRGRAREHARRVCRVCLGYGVVRPLRRGTHDQR